MNHLSCRLLASTLLAFGVLLAAHAQPAPTPEIPVVTVKQPRPRLSPHETIAFPISADNRVIIVYGRPYTKSPKNGQDRTVWGGTLVPSGQIWRLGADEATLLITPKSLVVGTSDTAVHLPAGIYSLYLFPESKDKVYLVINQQFGQWGLVYNQAQDLGRILMSKAMLSEPIHQFQMGFDKAPGGGVIKLMWEDTQFSVPFALGK